jgi:integrative and conjugative element protein (TIGR02256 family)
MRRFRQKGRYAREAGGQLFGFVTDECVNVTKAVGPSSWDERGLFSFRSDPNVAQKAIQRQHKRGLLYLGEWHTHAELIPRPSPSDLHAMQQLMKRSHLNTRALLLVILGLGHPDTDVGAWYVDENNFLREIVGSEVRV